MSRIGALSTLFFVGSLTPVLVPPVVHAQLEGVTWSESIQLDAAPGPDDYKTGTDDDAPEAISGLVSGTGYSIAAGFTFTSPAAPNITATISSSYQGGDLIALDGNAIGYVNFQFVVRQTSPPPVLVTTIPVDVEVQGRAEANGDGSLSAGASAGALFWTLLQGQIDSWQVSVNNSEGPTSDSFNESLQFLLEVDEVVNGGLTVSASSYPDVLENGTSASATGWADPVIDLADETIPGSSAKYSDHYEIEFAPGYWALGAPTPVQPATWGSIKGLYRK